METDVEVDVFRGLRPEPGVYTLPRSGRKVVIWYDENDVVHINGMGAIISPGGPQ